MVDIANLYGYSKAISIEEMLALYPNVHSFVHGSMSKTELAILKHNLLERMAILGYNESSLRAELKFTAIFLLSDAVNLELNLQVMSDLIASKHGRIDGGNYNS